MTKTELQEYVDLLDHGFWVTMVDLMVKRGYTQREIMQMLDSINYYPGVTMTDFIQIKTAPQN